MPDSLVKQEEVKFDWFSRDPRWSHLKFSQVLEGRRSSGSTSSFFKSLG
jgi:hypothetical protein